MGRLTRRALLAGVSAGIGLYAGRTLLAPTSATGPVFPVEARADNGAILLNDASELSPTPVAKHVVVTADPRGEVVENIRALMAEAQGAGRPFIAGAARHSMGGQSLAKNGSVLTLDQQWLEADPASKTYRVAAGARWSTVIARLDTIGFSPAVMQSNNDFGVASTYSVNAHGWPVRFSGCGSTVRSLKMLLADGAHMTCSRRENAELFRHAMGGYGLFGVITELELDMVPNSRLEPGFERVSGPDLGKRFSEMLDADASIQMAYGRLDVSLDRFFEDGLLIAYRPAADQSDLPSAIGSGFVSRASREIFRRQVGSDGVKHMRWWTETSLGPAIAGSSTRNSLMNEPVVTLNDLDPLRTDILHEYFVAPSRFAEFLALCREVIPASFQQLLNVTLRYVDADRDSVLAYATEPRIAAVMLFSQEKTVRGEADMARMTRELIERVLAIGGTYYLPYRPHASIDQLVRAYPLAVSFAENKRELDKGLLFRNHLWDAYFARL